MLAEHRIVEARRGEAHIADADLGRTLRPAGTAERIGEKLMAEADAENGRSSSRTHRRMARFSAISQGWSSTSHTSMGPPMTHNTS